MATLAAIETVVNGQRVAAIDLAAVLERAGAAPNAVRLVRERLAEADAVADRAGAALLPSLTLGGAGGWHRGTIQDTSGVFLEEVERQRVFLGANGEVTLDLRRVFDWSAAGRRADAAGADEEAVLQATAIDAAAAYYDLTGAQGRLAIARDALEHAEAVRGVAAAREARQLGLRLDRVRAEARAADTRQDEIAARELKRVASARLATLLRLDATVLLESAERQIRPVTFVSDEVPIEALIAHALAQRPDLRAQDLRAQAADDEATGATWGPLVPRVSAGVGAPGFFGAGAEGDNFGSLRDREDYYVIVGWTFEGFGLGDVARARSAAARARAEATQADAVRDRVALEVIEAREASRSARAAIDAARQGLAAADEARDLARARLEQGTGLALDVFQAQADRTRAAMRLVDAVVRYNQAQLRLLQRLGERP